MSFITGTANSFVGLLTTLNDFLTKGHTLMPAYTGSGNGVITALIGTSTSVQETITVTFSDATNFSVAGSVTGSMGSGTVGSAFTHARCQFTVTNGGTSWVNGDTIQFVMTPPWVCKRIRGGAYHIASVNFDITKVVDGSTATYTNPLATDLPQYGGLQLLQAAEVRSVRIAIYNAISKGPRDYAVQYSDNGTDWTNALAVTSQTWAQTYEQRVHDVPACGAHLYWRLYVSAANGANVDISEITFYTAVSGYTLDALAWFGDAIWMAPGNGDEDQIFVGVQLKWNAVGAYWCWRLAGFTGYAEGTTFGSQPGSSGGTSFMTLWDADIPYWLIADGKCFKVIAKISSQYEQAYLGFSDSYLSPGSYPYPLMIGGSMGFAGSAIPADTDTSYRYSSATDEHRAWWAPGGTNYANASPYGTVSMRFVSGSWVKFTGTHYYDFYTSQSYLWPYCNRGYMQDVRLNLDGSVSMLPIVISTPEGTFGEPDGVMALSGNNQSSENTLISNRTTWLVVQNVSRVGVLDYVAYRLS